MQAARDSTRREHLQHSEGFHAMDCAGLEQVGEGKGHVVRRPLGGRFA